MPFQLLYKDNSLVKDKISRLRDRNTSSEAYVRLIGDLSTLLAFHIAQGTPTEFREIATPRCPSTRQEFIPTSQRILVFSLFRGAAPMAHKLKTLLPNVGIVHVIYKDGRIVDIKRLPSNEEEYLRQHKILLADPIIGTGGSMLKVLDYLESRRVDLRALEILAIATAHRGVQTILQRCPEIRVWSLVEEQELSSDGYLIPGFGDVGDRVYGL